MYTMHQDLLREKETSLSSGGNGTIEDGAAAAFIQQVAACMAIGCVRLVCVRVDEIYGSRKLKTDERVVVQVWTDCPGL